VADLADNSKSPNLIPLDANFILFSGNGVENPRRWTYRADGQTRRYTLRVGLKLIRVASDPLLTDCLDHNSDTEKRSDTCCFTRLPTMFSLQLLRI
jgi:hypothetical protein